MGHYLNPGNAAYLEATQDEIFVDKTEMLRHLNSVVSTKSRYVCVTRPRGFGKTHAADMICAYYERGADSRELFEGLKISATEPVTVGGKELAWDHYLGAFDVVRVTMSEFLDSSTSAQEGVDRMERLVCREIVQAYPNADYFDTTDLLFTTRDAYRSSKKPFVIVIDDWDAPMHAREADDASRRAYLSLLCRWLKDKSHVALTFITGVLPLRRSETYSTLNMFWSHTMTDPWKLAPYVGFTDDEVKRICDATGLKFEEAREWYGGYRLSNFVPLMRSLTGRSFGKVYHMYNPLSVTSAAMHAQIKGYWSQDQGCEELASRVRLDIDGLKRKVALMMKGAHVPADVDGYYNDMSGNADADDIIAMLIHRGYLTWDDEAEEAYIPNREVMELFERATEGIDW